MELCFHFESTPRANSPFSPGGSVGDGDGSATTRPPPRRPAQSLLARASHVSVAFCELDLFGWSSSRRASSQGAYQFRESRGIRNGLESRTSVTLPRRENALALDTVCTSATHPPANIHQDLYLRIQPPCSSPSNVRL